MKIKTVYIAEDGREFTDQEACKSWEQKHDLAEGISFALFGSTKCTNAKLVVDCVEYLHKHYHLAKKAHGQVLNQGDNNR